MKRTYLFRLKNSTSVMHDLSIYLSGVIAIYSIFLLQNSSPGPNVLAVISTSMSIDRISGIAVALGVASGTLTWATLSVIGLSTIISKYASALYIVKIIGGTYLLWLAYKSLKSALSKDEFTTKKVSRRKNSVLGYIWRGYIINMTNPKAVLGWIAIVSIGLKQDAPLWVSIAIIMGTTLISLAVHLLYAVAFSTQTMVSVYSKARVYIETTLGLFFAFAGLKLLFSELYS